MELMTYFVLMAYLVVGIPFVQAYMELMSYLVLMPYFVPRIPCVQGLHRACLTSGLWITSPHKFLVFKTFRELLTNLVPFSHEFLAFKAYRVHTTNLLPLSHEFIVFMAYMVLMAYL